MKARLGIADGVNDPLRHVGHPPNPVEDLPSFEVVEERVNCEVAAEGASEATPKALSLRIRSSAPVMGSSPLMRGDRRKVATSMTFPPLKEHVHEPELPPDDARVPEQLTDLFRPGARRHIKILGLAIEQKVGSQRPTR